MDNLAIEKQVVQLNDIALHVITAGPDDGRTVLLLHGFPEFWYGWRHQIMPLAAAGYRVIVPDQRGYNLSDKPQHVSAYNLDLLVNDVIALMDVLGYPQVALVGHDWGGAVAWWLANKFPDRLSHLIALNSPHHHAMRQAMRRGWRQRRQSWHIAYFQLPVVPELSLRLFGWRGLVWGMKRSARPDTFAAEDWTHYRAAWSQPGAMTAMLNWYRALRRARPQRLGDARIRVPTLLMWGKRDTALGSDVAPSSIEWCDDGHLIWFDDATHWLQHDEPERVNQHILDFLKR